MTPETRQPKSSALGYLAAFTLGIVCTTCLLWVARNARQSPAAEGLSETAGDGGGAGGPAGRSRFIPSTPPRVHNLTLPPPAAGSTESAPVADAQMPGGNEESLEAGQAPAPRPVQVVEAVAATAPAVISAGGAVSGITGKVVLAGDPPPEKILPLDPRAAREFQGKDRPTTRFYVVAPDGGLADVTVFVSAGLPDREWPRVSEPLRVRFRGYQMEPYVAAARTGQPIEFSNTGRDLHNLLILPAVAGNQEGNYTLTPRSRALRLKFDNPELFIRCKCGVHPWEFAYISTFDHPFFAVTDAKGEFRLPVLPPGRYTLEAHHRKAGSIKQDFEVTPDGARVDFTFRVPAETQASLN